MKSQQFIVMVGPSLDGRGGIASVAAIYRDAGLFERCGIVYLTSHRNASTLNKLIALLRGLQQMWSLLAAGRVRLVHIHVAYGLSFWRKALFGWSALLWRRPLLIHIHSGRFDHYHANASRGAQAHMRALMVRAKRVIVLSDMWIERLRPICPKAHWVSLPNPVTVRPLPQRAAATGDAVRVLFLGRYVEAKGVFELVQAFAQAHARDPRLRLILGGEGDRDGLLCLARALDVDHEVQLLGWVTGAAKDEWLDRCEIFALPSHFEGLPVSMLEAMAAALAVVVTPVGSVPEVVTHGRDGWLVPVGQVAPLAEALLELASNSTLRGQLGEAARALMEDRYAAPKVCARLERLYADLGCLATVRESC